MPVWWMRLLGRPAPIVKNSICSTAMLRPAARSYALIAAMRARTSRSPSPDCIDAGLEDSNHPAVTMRTMSGVFRNEGLHGVDRRQTGLV
jgi:hypothetical protein